MTVTEALMKPGSASIEFVSDVPTSIVDQIFDIINDDTGPGAHVIVTPSHVDPAVGSGGLLAAALWTGRITERRSRTQLMCAGLGSWLETYNHANISNTSGTPSDWLTDILVNNLSTGSATTSGTTAVTREFPAHDQTRLQALETVAALGGWEYRINPDFTVDAGTADNVFATTASESTPLVVLSPDGGANDWVYKGVPAQIVDQALDLSQLTTRTVVLGAGGYVGTDTATIGLKTYTGTTPDLTDVRVASAEDDANTDTFAGLVMDDRTQRWQARATTRTPLVRNLVTPGDSVFVYDPTAGMVDSSQQIDFRGEKISPVKTRCIELTWPIERGMGVYIRSNAASPTIIDVTQWVKDEGTTAYWVVGDAPVPSILTARQKGSTGRTGGGGSGVGIGTSTGATTVINYNAQAPVAVTYSGTSYTVDPTDHLRTIYFTNSSQVTVTLPTEASDDLVPAFRCMLYASGAGGLTLSTTGLTLTGSPNTTVEQGQGLYVERTGATNVWIVVGGTS